jgi:chemotaxis protein methyltransferase CheR
MAVNIHSNETDCLGWDAMKAELTWNEFLLFRQWLYDEAGIQLADAKQALVAGRLGKRLRVLSMNSFRQYFDYIQGAGSTPSRTDAQLEEHQIALDLLTTNETYFLRENAHFDFLKNKVLPLWKERPLHCWSAASSSGEEAYTLAMLLADHHVGKWKITGTDLNSGVVKLGQQAMYSMDRAKNIPRPWLQKYCLKGIEDKVGTFRMASMIRQQVNFKQANLQHAQHGIGPFDVIFLRNVMIYFDVASKKKVLANVIERLKPDGFLLVGHAESLNGISDRIRLVSPSIYKLSDVV